MTNAEKFKTAEERARAFDKWCKNSRSKSRGPACKVDMPNCFTCQFAWLDLDADNDKPLPCPYCGRNMEDCFIGIVTWKGTCVCGYETQQFPNKQDAILAHNRVARAVMDAGKKEEK